MRQFKELSKEEQIKVLDKIMASNAEDILKKGQYYQSLSNKDKDALDKIKDNPGVFCGCYACVQSILNNMKTFAPNIREGMIGRAMQQAEKATYP